MNPMNTVKEEFYSQMGDYLPDCINVDVSYPDSETNKIMKIYQKVKEVDNELDNEIFSIHLRYIFSSQDTIYVCKKEKYSFILSIQNKLADLSYIADDFFSRLVLSKNDKLNKIIEYCSLIRIFFTNYIYQ